MSCVKTLLCAVKGLGKRSAPVKLAGDVALEAPADLAVGLALGAAARNLGYGSGIAAHTSASYDVNGLLQRAVSCPVEAVAGYLQASIGLDPASLAKAVSLRQRPGWENDTMAWAALTGLMPGRLVSPGASSPTIASSSARLALSARDAFHSAIARRRISPCRTARSRLAPRGTADGSARPGRRRRDGCGPGPRRRPAGPGARLVCAVAVVVSSRHAHSKIGRASRSPSARGVGSLPASSCGAARWASIGSDLPLPPRYCGSAARIRSPQARRLPLPGPVRRRSCGRSRTPPAR